MQDGLYVISGETFDGNEVIAGWGLFKKLKKKLRKLKKLAMKGLKFAAPALSLASFAMPALAPAAAAASMASRLSHAAKGGHRPARAAMRMFASSADRGDDESARFLAILQRMMMQQQGAQAAPPTLLNSAQVRELARRARHGNPKARRMLQHVAGLADSGDPAAQAMLEQAAGTARWDIVSGSDLQIMGSGCAPSLPPPVEQAGSIDIVSGGPVWDFLKPRRGYRDEQHAWGPRDAYHLGIEAAPPR